MPRGRCSLAGGGGRGGPGGRFPPSPTERCSGLSCSATSTTTPASWTGRCASPSANAATPWCPVGDFWLQDCSWDTGPRTYMEGCPSLSWSPLMRLAMRAPVPVVVIDGNHEAWPCLAAYAQRPDVVEARAAGRPLHLGGSLWWADRGSTWTWGGTRCGALGGAVSPDKFIPRLAPYRWPRPRSAQPGRPGAAARQRARRPGRAVLSRLPVGGAGPAGGARGADSDLDPRGVQGRARPPAGRRRGERAPAGCSTATGTSATTSTSATATPRCSASIATAGSAALPCSTSATSAAPTAPAAGASPQRCRPGRLRRDAIRPGGARAAAVACWMPYRVGSPPWMVSPVESSSSTNSSPSMSARSDARSSGPSLGSPYGVGFRP